ncbi:MAG TPA: ribonucleoside-diphosphate reductase subunit alpha [Urbifossiella sp.]|jgi:ribonucleoside-diphosphate reductase alpha chain|nr:ribonucleoside-diphosphate reductase subunit alpha [Urbifossiella sp.]
MQVRKRNGALEAVDVNKIVRAVARCAGGLTHVDAMRVAVRTIGGLYDGATTAELDRLSIQTAAGLIAEEPEYSRLAARLLATYIDKEVENQDVHSFSQSIAAGYRHGLIAEGTFAFVAANARKLNAAAGEPVPDLYEYFGLRTVYDRYLLRHPETRHVIETPAFFFLRVACGLADTAADAIEFYRLLAAHRYLPSTPTLFNSGTARPQMSSCFAAGTPVYTTNRGLVPIEEVVVGDQTITHTGGHAVVTQLHGSPLGDRTLWNVTVSGVPAITVTGNHRFWASRYDRKRGSGEPTWIAADDLEVGDYVALAAGSGFDRDSFTIVPGEHKFGRGLVFGEIAADGMVPVSIRWTTADHLNGTGGTLTRTRKMSRVRAAWRFDSGTGARFLGQWFGDGTVLHRRNNRPSGISLVFANKERALADRWAAAGERIFGVEALFTTNAGRNWSNVAFHSAVVGELFAAVFGRYSHERRIPAEFFATNRGFMVSFLKGLIESDGCVSKDATVSVTLTNLALIAGLAAWGRSHGLPITSAPVPKYETGPFRRQASIRIPCWALPLGDIGKVYDDDRVSRLGDAAASTKVRVIGGRTFLRVAGKSAAERVEAVYNLGVAHDDHSYSVNGLSVANCYLLDSPADDLEAIYARYSDVAKLSKFAGGIGLAYHRIRSRGSLIRGTNGHSNGIVPWLKTLDSSVAAVNQGGKRKGACCVYLETWHADVEEFLELRDNTGDPARRTYNLNLANWVPDLFMRRVEAGADWSLFDPKVVPHLTDLFGAAFDAAYAAAEAKGLATKRVPARDLYAHMMKTLAETGNGWMTFKDACNRACNQTGGPGAVVHSSNLCTEIVEVSSAGETAVCNLGSVNLARHVGPDGFDFAALAETVRVAVRFLDRVVDVNFYPTPEAAASNQRWRPVGLGVMGLQDVFFKLRLPFDAPAARELSRKIQEEIYYHALAASCDLAAAHGPHPSFAETRAAGGVLQFDLWGAAPADPARWESLRARVCSTGLRNSLLVAIAPTATIASIVGTYECVEPQVSNLFKRETLSGEFLQLNRYLVDDLKVRGLWTDAVRARIKLADGSVQGIEELPAEVRAVYRTAWEVPMRSLIDMAADRGPFIDQSQSLNLFLESPTIGKMSSMYMYAWQKGLKTTYYLRSRPATAIAKTTVTKAAAAAPQAVACSLENPGACEACQ